MQTIAINPKIKEIICEVRNLSGRGTPLAPRDLGEDELLFDVDATGAENLGLDSLDALEVSLRLEEEFGITIPDHVDPHDFATVRKLVSLVERLQAGQS